MGNCVVREMRCGDFWGCLGGVVVDERGRILLLGELRYRLSRGVMWGVGESYFCFYMDWVGLVCGWLVGCVSE